MTVTITATDRQTDYDRVSGSDTVVVLRHTDNDIDSESDSDNSIDSDCDSEPETRPVSRARSRPPTRQIGLTQDEMGQMTLASANVDANVGRLQQTVDSNNEEVEMVHQKLVAVQQQVLGALLP